MAQVPLVGLLIFLFFKCLFSVESVSINVLVALLALINTIWVWCLAAARAWIWTLHGKNYEVHGAAMLLLV